MISHVLSSLAADTIILDFDLFLATQAKEHRVSQAAIISALRPRITPSPDHFVESGKMLLATPSQPEVSSHAPAADTPATQAAGETTDGGSFPSSLAGDLPSVAPSPEPRPFEKIRKGMEEALLFVKGEAEPASVHTFPEPQPDLSAVQADAAPPRDVTSPAESDAAEISAPIIPPRRKRAPKASQPQSRDLHVQQRIIALHAEHPDWSDIEIAKHLDCKDSYVRRVAKQSAIVLPSRLQAVVLRQQQEIAEAPPPPTSGTLTERVQEMHKRHPSWTARMIASALGAPLASVQSLLTFARNARPASPTFQNRADLVDHYKNVSKRLGK